MRIALAQMNSTLGDIESNYKVIRENIRQAEDKNCDLVVFPELALLGYNPCDLLERPGLFEEQEKWVKKIEKSLSGKTQVLVGALRKDAQGNLYNSALLLGCKRRHFSKHCLPSYDVFDEPRFFARGSVDKNIFTLNKKKIFVMICEDLWSFSDDRYKKLFKEVRRKGVDYIAVLNASPYSEKQQQRRVGLAASAAKYFKAPLVYVNMTGAQDELIFDGCSFAIDKKGTIVSQSAAFCPDLNVVDFYKNLGGVRELPKKSVHFLRQALVLGLRDFASKNNLHKMHLGLSGGIDSAVALCLAADALGPLNVTAIAMPGPYSSDQSLQLAEKLVENVGCDFYNLPIDETYSAHIKSFENSFGSVEFGLVHENLQARLRAVGLMMFANNKNSLLVTTGNKSEMAVGYSTLYGDMCGGISPLGDLLKGQVYALAECYNQEYELIPEGIIQRAPSAELRPNQKDQDSLPPYPELDKAVHRIVTECKAPRGKTEKWVFEQVSRNEFKRWQAPPILRVTDHAFGRGRRMPISGAKI